MLTVQDGAARKGSLVVLLFEVNKIPPNTDTLGNKWYRIYRNVDDHWKGLHMVEDTLAHLSNSEIRRSPKSGST